MDALRCPRCDGPGRDDGWYGLFPSCTAEVRAWAEKQGEIVRARAVEVAAAKAEAEALVDHTPWWKLNQ